MISVPRALVSSHSPLPTCFHLFSPFFLFKNIFTILLYFCSFFLEYACFTVFCWFLPGSTGNQLYVFMCSLLFGFPSHLARQGPLVKSPAQCNRSSSVTYSIHGSVHLSVPVSQLISPAAPSLGSVSLFSVCLSLFLLCE